MQIDLKTMSDMQWSCNENVQYLNVGMVKRVKICGIKQCQFFHLFLPREFEVPIVVS